MCENLQQQINPNYPNAIHLMLSHLNVLFGFFSSLINYTKFPIHPFLIFSYPVKNVTLFFFSYEQRYINWPNDILLPFNGLECLSASFVKTSERQTASAKTINKKIKP